MSDDYYNKETDYDKLRDILDSKLLDDLEYGSVDYDIEFDIDLEDED